MAFALIPPQPSTVGRTAGGLTVREVRCNSLLHPLAYRGSTGYTANLYRGCTHGCVYCYAPSLTHDERRWGSYVDVKMNAPPGPAEGTQGNEEGRGVSLERLRPIPTGGGKVWHNKAMPRSAT